MKYGVIGEHLPHSYSKDIHDLIGLYPYEIHEVPKDKVQEFMQEKDFLGINVTIPYKETVIPYLNEVSDRVKRIGACNTIVNQNGKLIGDNTDYFGFMHLLQKANFDLSSKTVLILGTGGTSKMAQVVAKDLGATEILVASRNPKEGEISYEKAISLASCVDYMINTTPVGMYPKYDGSPISLSAFSKLLGVADVIYNPARTTLALEAKKKGIPYITGLYMLVDQAVVAGEQFANQKLPNVTDSIYQTLFAKKENIVLIGMPGCGKTTIGKILASNMNREFVDLDDEIEKAIGGPIAPYIDANGESAFRDVESKILTKIAREKRGIVLSTGGGAILREQNVIELQRDGILFFIDRDLSCILPTEDRPLSRDRDALQKRFDERYPIYTSVSDYHIQNPENPNLVASRIEKEFFK